MATVNCFQALSALARDIVLVFMEVLAPLNVADADARYVVSTQGSQGHQIIGRGSFGCIKRAHDAQHNCEVAIKFISNPYRSPHVAISCIREVICQSSLLHPNIVAFHDAYILHATLHLVMEICLGDLYSILRGQDLYDRLTCDDVIYYSFQLIEAVRYLHSRHVIHRDIKPSNILIGKDGRIKLCDFGMAREVNATVHESSMVAPSASDLRAMGGHDGDLEEFEEHAHAKSAGILDARYTEYVVTRWYRAPEVILSCGVYSYGQDMWAVGCTLAEFLSRKPLFPGISFSQQIELITEVLGKPRRIDMHFPMTFYGRRFLEKLKHCNGTGLFDRLPQQMLTLETYPHFVHLIGDLLNFDPTNRITASEALLYPIFTNAEFYSEECTYLAAFADAVPEPEPIQFDELRNARHESIPTLAKMLNSYVDEIHLAANPPILPNPIIAPIVPIRHRKRHRKASSGKKAPTAMAPLARVRKNVFKPPVSRLQSTEAAVSPDCSSKRITILPNALPKHVIYIDKGIPVTADGADIPAFHSIEPVSLSNISAACSSTSAATTSSSFATPTFSNFNLKMLTSWASWKVKKPALQSVDSACESPNLQEGSKAPLKSSSSFRNLLRTLNVGGSSRKIGVAVCRGLLVETVTDETTDFIPEGVGNSARLPPVTAATKTEERTTSGRLGPLTRLFASSGCKKENYLFTAEEKQSLVHGVVSRH